MPGSELWLWEMEDSSHTGARPEFKRGFFWSFCWVIEFLLKWLIITVSVIFRAFLTTSRFPLCRCLGYEKHWPHFILMTLEGGTLAAITCWAWVKHHVLKARKMTSWNLLALKLAFQEECPLLPHRPTINKHSKVNITAVLFFCCAPLFSNRGMSGLRAEGRKAANPSSYFPVWTCSEMLARFCFVAPQS